MLFVGSVTGKNEIEEMILPVLQDEMERQSNFHFIPLYPTLQPYLELLLDSPEFFKMFWNSCMEVFPIVIGQLLISVPAAWGFAHFTFPGKKILFLLYTILMILPFQVTMVSSYLVMDKLKLMDSQLAIILPGVFSTFPVFILVQFFKAIPKPLFEAAQIDGAGEVKMFFFIGVPLGIPGIFSMIILNFLEYWNAIEQPLIFLKSEDKLPLSLYLPNITAQQAGVSFAASMLTLALPLFLFLFAQPYLELGIQASGIKE